MAAAPEDVGAPEGGGVSDLYAEVPPTETGVRLDVFLGRLAGVGSRSQAARLIDDGAVAVDGIVRSRSFKLEAGDVVTVAARPDVVIPVPEDVALAVPFEDQWLLVVDKPAGMVVHPAPGHPAGTLVNALVARGIAGGESHRPGIVHRLDRDTSGLLIVAKDDAVHRRLQQMLQAREIDRRYLALVVGSPSSPRGTIEAPVGRDPRRRTAMAVGGAAQRSAVTHFRVRERLGGFTLLEIKLQTGRTHQIRVHLQAIGLPVVGDPVYGAKDPVAVGRQFLHSHRLRFTHPVTREVVDVTSPLPIELAVALAEARRRAS